MCHTLLGGEKKWTGHSSDQPCNLLDAVVFPHAITLSHPGAARLANVWGERFALISAQIRWMFFGFCICMPKMRAPTRFFGILACTSHQHTGGDIGIQTDVFAWSSMLSTCRLRSMCVNGCITNDKRIVSYLFSGVVPLRWLRQVCK
jgi:hypothetical protein